jgi:hypothetical protein
MPRLAARGEPEGDAHPPVTAQAWQSTAETPQTPQSGLNVASGPLGWLPI